MGKNVRTFVVRPSVYDHGVRNNSFTFFCDSIQINDRQMGRDMDVGTWPWSNDLTDTPAVECPKQSSYHKSQVEQ
jgi:hypothetical protein